MLICFWLILVKVSVPFVSGIFIFLKFTLPNDAVTLAKSKISEESDSKTIYAAVSTLKSLKKPGKQHCT